MCYFSTFSSSDSDDMDTAAKKVVFFAKHISDEMVPLEYNKDEAGSKNGEST